MVHFVLNIDFWEGSFVYVALSIIVPSTRKLLSSCFFLKKRFSFFRKFVSKLKYWKHWKLPVIVTKNRRTYAPSVGFKMKPLRKSVFLCYGKNQSNYAIKVAERSNRSLPIYLMKNFAQTSILLKIMMMMMMMMKMMMISFIVRQIQLIYLIYIRMYIQNSTDNPNSIIKEKPFSFFICFSIVIFWPCRKNCIMKN